MTRVLRGDTLLRPPRQKHPESSLTGVIRRLCKVSQYLNQLSSSKHRRHHLTNPPFSRLTVELFVHTITVLHNHLIDVNNAQQRNNGNRDTKQKQYLFVSST